MTNFAVVVLLFIGVHKINLKGRVNVSSLSSTLFSITFCKIQENHFNQMLCTSLALFIKVVLFNLFKNKSIKVIILFLKEEGWGSHPTHIKSVIKQGGQNFSNGTLIVFNSPISFSQFKYHRYNPPKRQ